MSMLNYVPSHLEVNEYPMIDEEGANLSITRIHAQSINAQRLQVPAPDDLMGSFHLPSLDDHDFDEKLAGHESSRGELGKEARN